MPHDDLQVAARGTTGRRRGAHGAKTSGAEARAGPAPEAAGPAVDQWQGPAAVRLRLWPVDAADRGGTDRAEIWRAAGRSYAVGCLLAELDITPQKPLRRAYERDPAAIKRWTTTVFPRLRARAKRVGADDLLSRRGRRPLRSSPGAHAGLRGQTPEVATSGRRQSVSAISAVNARGAFWYEIYTERLNAPRFVERLTHFMRGRKNPVFLVLDSHPAHIAKVVAQYVQGLVGRLELHFLPGYAPELNPDEFVWNHLKRQGVSKTPLRKDESLRSRVQSDLAAIQSRPALVRSFFHAPSVAYTRD